MFHQIEIDQCNMSKRIQNDVFWFKPTYNKSIVMEIENGFKHLCCIFFGSGFGEIPFLAQMIKQFTTQIDITDHIQLALILKGTIEMWQEWMRESFGVDQ